MDDERQAWYKQYSKNFGPRELARFGCAFMVWMVVGAVLSILLRLNELFLFFLIVPFAFALVALQWKPAYSLFRRILGNKNLPTEPMPGIRIKAFMEQRQWWIYLLLAAWGLLIDLVLLYVFMKYLSK